MIDQLLPFLRYLEMQTSPALVPDPSHGVQTRAGDSWPGATLPLRRSSGGVLGRQLDRPAGGVLGLLGFAGGLGAPYSGMMAAGDDDFCKRIRNMCIAQCSDTSLPSGDSGFNFWNCVNKCMQRYGCPTVRG
jgi:hypothetical protein